MYTKNQNIFGIFNNNLEIANTSLKYPGWEQ